LKIKDPSFRSRGDRVYIFYIIYAVVAYPAERWPTVGIEKHIGVGFTCFCHVYSGMAVEGDWWGWVLIFPLCDYAAVHGKYCQGLDANISPEKDVATFESEPIRLSELFVPSLPAFLRGIWYALGESLFLLTTDFGGVHLHLFVPVKGSWILRNKVEVWRVRLPHPRPLSERRGGSHCMSIFFNPLSPCLLLLLTSYFLLQPTLQSST